MANVIFDTNFWSYLAYSNMENQFYDLENTLGLNIQLTPSILLEVEKTNEKEKRIEIIKIMNKGNRKKCRTEADLESDELITEVRRLRPIYRNTNSDIRRVDELRNFWQKRIWQKAIIDTEVIHKRAIEDNVKYEKAIINEEEYNKISMKNANVDINKLDLLKIKSKLNRNVINVPEIIDCEIEYESWRIFCLCYYLNILTYVNHSVTSGKRTVADWCEPWIKINEFIADKEQFYKFWLNEVKLQNMQRNWLRWAIRALQPLKKVGVGNVYDEQHSAYLIGMDYFFTCDRRYYDILIKIYKSNIVKMAKPVLLNVKCDIAFNEIIAAINNY